MDDWLLCQFFKSTSPNITLRRTEKKQITVVTEGRDVTNKKSPSDRAENVESHI